MERGLFGVDPDGLRARFSEIFQDRCIFIREVIQNSVQAIRMLPPDVRSAGTISVTLTATALDITDNGIGMEADEAQHAISRFFGSSWVTASQRTKRPDEDLAAMLRQLLDGDDDDDESLRLDQVSPSDIGRFGVGLTTCLMIADCFEVRTHPRSGGPGSIHRLLVGNEGHLPTVQYEWEVCSAQPSPGTCVSIPLNRLRKGGGGDCLNESRLRQRIERYFALCDVPISLNGQVLCGGDPDPLVIPDMFREVTRPAQDEGALFVTLARRSPDGGYLRARIGLAGKRREDHSIDVYGRGILVGTLPTVEVLGDGLSMVTGVIDSNMFDLQLDRNRLSRDDRLQAFQRTFRRWFCEALAQTSQDKWPQYAAAFDLHREELLTLLYKNADATQLLGPRVPFQSALDPGEWLPFEYVLGHVMTARNGSQVLPYASGRSRDHVALRIIAERGVAVPLFASVVPAAHGKINLDLLFVVDHLMTTKQRIRPMRIDALLEEIALLCPTGSLMGDDRALCDFLAHRYQDWIRLAPVELPLLDVPVLVGVPHRQAHEEELPGNPIPEWALDSQIDHREVAKMALETLVNSVGQKLLQRLMSDDGDATSADMTAEDIGARFEEQFNRSDKRPVVILNFSHSLVKKDKSLPKRISGIEAVILGRLLRAGTGDQDQLLERLEMMVLQLTDNA